MRTHRTWQGMTFAAMTLVTLAVNASSDESPKPGGVFQLKPGVFVANGQSCADPASAALRQYDGKGISGSATHACKAVVVKQTGNRFTVDQSCIDSATGPGPRTSERQSVTVTDALTFVLRANGNTTTYHYCPNSQLPSWLKQKS